MLRLSGSLAEHAEALVAPARAFRSFEQVAVASCWKAPRWNAPGSLQGQRGYRPFALVDCASVYGASWVRVYARASGVTCWRTTQQRCSRRALAGWARVAPLPRCGPAVVTRCTRRRTRLRVRHRTQGTRNLRAGFARLRAATRAAHVQWCSASTSLVSCTVALVLSLRRDAAAPRRERRARRRRAASGPASSCASRCCSRQCSSRRSGRGLARRRRRVLEQAVRTAPRSRGSARRPRQSARPARSLRRRGPAARATASSRAARPGPPCRRAAATARARRLQRNLCAAAASSVARRRGPRMGPAQRVELRPDAGARPFQQRRARPRPVCGAEHGPGMAGRPWRRAYGGAALHERHGGVRVGARFACHGAAAACCTPKAATPSGACSAIQQRRQPSGIAGAAGQGAH